MPELIDRDDLMRKHTTSLLHNNKHNTVEELKVLLKLIKDAPTVDAVPVVHGYWKIGETGKLECSKCGVPSAMSRNFAGLQYMSKWCPNCGVKIDKKER